MNPIELLLEHKGVVYVVRSRMVRYLFEQN